MGSIFGHKIDRDNGVGALKGQRHQPRPQGAFPWLREAREKRPGDEVAAAQTQQKLTLVPPPWPLRCQICIA